MSGFETPRRAEKAGASSDAALSCAPRSYVIFVFLGGYLCVRSVLLVVLQWALHFRGSRSIGASLCSTRVATFL